jgi:hypothetical protein
MLALLRRLDVAQTQLRGFARGLSSLALPKHSLENSEQNPLARNA